MCSILTSDEGSVGIRRRSCALSVKSLVIVGNRMGVCVIELMMKGRRK